MSECTCNNAKNHTGNCPLKTTNASRLRRSQAKKAAAIKKLNADSLAVIEQFMPNIGKCFGVDIKLVNETLMSLRSAIK